MLLRQSFLVVCVGAFCYGKALADESLQPAYKSPLGIILDDKGTRAYVALHRAGTVAVVDVGAGKVLAEIPVGRKPYDVALSGDSLFVSCEGDDTLVRVDVKQNRATGRWKVRQGPRDLLIRLEKRAFVACHDGNSVCALDIRTGNLNVVDVPGRPERLIDSYLVLALVANPGEAQVLSIQEGAKGLAVVPVARLRGVSNARALAAVRGAGLVAHQSPRTKVPATQISQGWIFTNMISPVSIGLGYSFIEAMGPKLLDEPNRGFPDPSDLVGPPPFFEQAWTTHSAFVACAGADAVLALRLLDWPPKNIKGTVDDTGKYRAAGDLSASRHFVVARLNTQANPRRLALSGDSKVLVAANYLGDSLTVIDAHGLRVLRHIPLGNSKPDAARRGEILFNSNKMTFHGQFTCASCHPNGGADGLNWDLSRDGIGNPMNTRSLLGVKDTAPYGWLSNSPTLSDRVAGTLRTLHHHEPQGTAVADIVAYLKTLEPPRPLPHRKEDEAASARGRRIFQGKGKCANCHRRLALDDDAMHDVGTRITGDHQDKFDTPSLRGVWRTAPYLHHGQAKTLTEVFTEYNPRQRHGAAHRLTEAELADVISFLNSL